MKRSATPPFFTGIFWYLLSLFIGVFNDTVMKTLGHHYSVTEIVFWRYFYASLSCFLLFFFPKYRHCFAPRALKLHSIRGIFLFSAILFYCYALYHLPLATVTSLNFTIPLFTLILAKLFLQEKVGWRRTIASIIGFSGVYIILQPRQSSWITFPAIVLLFSSLLFAGLDVINKKFVSKEGVLSMVFYTAIGALILAFPFMLYHHNIPTAKDMCSFMLLGIGANILLFCILMAFQKVSASTLAPFRYVELLLSIAVGGICFHEHPTFHTILGAMIIIPCTLYITYISAQETSD